MKPFLSFKVQIMRYLKVYFCTVLPVAFLPNSQISEQFCEECDQNLDQFWGISCAKRTLTGLMYDFNYLKRTETYKLWKSVNYTKIPRKKSKTFLSAQFFYQPVDSKFNFQMLTKNWSKIWNHSWQNAQNGK